jgi:hypothetical protein
MRSTAIFLVCIVIGISLYPNSANARTWQVKKDGTGDFAVIQPAVEAAASGDSILIGPGRYDNFQYSADVKAIVRITAEKDLYFIGEGAESVTIGFFTPLEETWVTGINSPWYLSNTITIQGIKFLNLHAGAGVTGNIIARDCIFQSVRYAIELRGGGESTIQYCNFTECWSGVTARDCDSVLIENCELTSSYEGTTGFNFFNITQADIISCNVNGDRFALYENSNGNISNCTADTKFRSCVQVRSGSLVLVENCTLSGAVNCLNAQHINTNIEFKNTIIQGGSHSALHASEGAIVSASGCDIYRREDAPYVVKTKDYSSGWPLYKMNLGGNFWGNVGPGAEDIDAYILDKLDDPQNNVIVEYSPNENSPVPSESTSWGTVKCLFR